MDASIAQFTDITGATSEQAQFFLQSANGDLETAMSTYYESGGATASSGQPEAAASQGNDNEDQEMAAALAASQADIPAASSQPQTLGGGTPAPATATSSASTSSRPSPSAAIRPTPSTNKKKFGTFATLAGGGNNDDDSDDEDKKKPQNYFAGGEKSGISVQDPNAGKKRNRDDPGSDAPNDLVRSLLKKAAEGSAYREQQEQSTSAASSSSQAFRGSGNTLGSEDTPSQVVPDPEAPAARPSSSRGSFLPSLPGMYPRGFANLFGGGGGQPAAQQQEEAAEDDRDLPEDYNDENVTRHLTLWRDGFSVEDGELMRYDEPRNMALLKAIQEGTAPQHILNVRFGQQVELRVAQRTGEDYVPPPKKPMKAFRGSGNRLGAPTSATASPSTSSTPAPASILQGGSSAPSSSSAAASSSSSVQFEVDVTKPITTLQIRLGDGTRQTARFNHSHRISDIRQWINAGNPGMSTRNYVLMTTFPSKELSDEEMSIEEAKLMGSVVVQKWT